MTNSFEIILFGDGAMLMQYKDMDPTHLSWSTESIGFEDGTGECSNGPPAIATQTVTQTV